MEEIDIIKLDSILNFLKNDNNNFDLFKVFEKKYNDINEQFQTTNIYEKTQLIEEYVSTNNIFDEIIKIYNESAVLTKLNKK